MGDIFFSESHERLLALYDRLDELDANKAKAKAGFILHGLGFTKEMQNTQVCYLLSFFFLLVCCCYFSENGFYYL